MHVIICVHSCMYIFPYSHARFNMCAFIDVYWLQVKRFVCICCVLKSDKFIPYSVEKRPHVPLYDQHAYTTIYTRLSRWLIRVKVVVRLRFRVKFKVRVRVGYRPCSLGGRCVCHCVQKRPVLWVLLKNTNPGARRNPGGEINFLTRK